MKIWLKITLFYCAKNSVVIDNICKSMYYPAYQINNINNHD